MFINMRHPKRLPTIRLPALLCAEGEHGLKKVARYPHPMVREQAIGGVKPPLVALVILDEQLLPKLR